MVFLTPTEPLSSMQGNPLKKTEAVGPQQPTLTAAGGGMSWGQVSGGGRQQHPLARRKGAGGTSLCKGTKTLGALGAFKEGRSPVLEQEKRADTGGSVQA